MLYNYQLNKKNVNRILYWALFAVIYFVSYKLFTQGSWITNMFIFIIANTLVVLFLFKGSFEIRFYMAVFYSVVIFLTEIIGIIILDIFVDRVKLYIDSTTFFVAFVSKVLTFIVIRLSCTLTRGKLKEIKFKILHIFSICLIETSIILNILIYNVLNYSFSILHLLYLLTGYIGFIVVALLNMSLLTTTFESYAIVQKLKEQELRFKLEHEQYQMMLDKYEYIKIIKHDMNKRMNILESYIINDEKDKAIEYINKLRDNINDNKGINSTGSLGIDVVLNSLWTKTERENIKLDINIEDVVKDAISDTDMCIILGNITDNAVESCLKSKDKHISIDIYLKGQTYIIKVINSCSEFPKMLFGMPVTTKLDRENHGFGTKSIKHTLEKYNGMIYFNPDREKGTFETAVSIPLSNVNKTKPQDSQA